MDMKICKLLGGNEGDCRGDTPGSAFFDSTENVSMPSKLGHLVVYVFLLVIAWYALIYVFKFVLSLVKPVLIVVAAMFLFRFLLTFQSTDMKDMFIQFSSPVMHVVSEIVGLFKRLLD